MRIAGALLTMVLWGCSQERSEPSAGNAKQALRTLIRQPGESEARKACKLLLKSASIEEAGQYCFEVVDQMMTEGSAPSKISRGMTPSQYKDLTPRALETVKEASDVMGVELYKVCRKA